MGGEVCSSRRSGAGGSSSNQRRGWDRRGPPLSEFIKMRVSGNGHQDVMLDTTKCGVYVAGGTDSVPMTMRDSYHPTSNPLPNGKGDRIWQRFCLNRRTLA